MQQKHIKNKNVEKYKYICSLGNGDFRQGLIKYRVISAKIKESCAKMYFELLEKRQISSFYKKHCAELYSSEVSFSTSLSRFLFNDDKFLLSFKMYQKGLMIIDKYSIFLGHQDNHSTTAST
ncbi:MAG: hypothetical protein ACWGHH_06775 [Sulfurovaceae bacterium]